MSTVLERFPWAAPGNDVALIDGSMAGARYHLSKVDRVTPTQIVLEGDRRFVTDSYTLREYGQAWTRYRTRLVAADDPELADIDTRKAAKAAEELLRKAVEQAWILWTGSLNRTPEQADLIIAALQAWKAGRPA